MRGRVRGNSNMLWWYGGDGDVGRYENMTSDCLTTTEDATECTDAKMRDSFKVYPVHGSRVTRTCSPAQYFYPVKKRSRRRCIPLTYPLPYEGQRNTPTQPQIFLRDRRPSRKSLVVGPRRRAAYRFTQPPSPLPPPDPVRKNQKVLVYSSTFPAQCEEEQQHAKVFWRKMKKYPGKGKIVSWCSQAIDSSTSADAKSVHSNYSRLSVDVTNEMAAMNRDIETILTRYESAFDNSILNELEERGLGKKKKHKPDLAVKTTLPQLTPEQQNLLAMEKPPLERLAEIPIEYLKPRPPPSVSVKETTQETANTSSISGSVVWKGMLQDLVNRGIMDKLDNTSLAKLQSALNEATVEPETKGVVLSPGTSLIAGSLTKKEESLTGATCVLRPDEKTVLSEVDERFHYASDALKTPSVHYVFSAASRIPNLVERFEDLIPVNNVNDNTNWKKKLEEIQKESSKSHCESCKTLTEQLNLFKRGGSGDKLSQDKSVNTDIGQNPKDELDGSCSKNLSSGDQNASGAHGMSEGSVGQERKSSSTISITLQDNVKEIESNVTVNSLLTDGSMKVNSLSSGTTSCICEELTTNPSSALGMSRVVVEDVEEEELPLQRTLESTSLGNGSRSSMLSHIRRPIKPISIASQLDKYNQHSQSASNGTRVAKQGAGDSQAVGASGFKKDLASLVQSISPGRNASSHTIDQNLTELNKSISHNPVLLDTEMCLDIIWKLAELMLSNEPVSGKDRKESNYTPSFKQMSMSHLRHIKQEVAHIRDLDKWLNNRPTGVKSSQKSSSAGEFP